MSNRVPQLGDMVKESVTGLTGVVVCISTSLNGCRQVCVVPRKLEAGKPVDGQWYDDARVKVIEAGAVKASPRFAEKDGGPATNPMPSAN